MRRRRSISSLALRSLSLEVAARGKAALEGSPAEIEHVPWSACRLRRTRFPHRCHPRHPSRPSFDSPPASAGLDRYPVSVRSAHRRRPRLACLRRAGRPAGDTAGGATAHRRRDLTTTAEATTHTRCQLGLRGRRSSSRSRPPCRSVRTRPVRRCAAPGCRLDAEADGAVAGLGDGGLERLDQRRGQSAAAVLGLDGDRRAREHRRRRSRRRGLSR